MAECIKRKPIIETVKTAAALGLSFAYEEYLAILRKDTEFDHAGNAQQHVFSNHNPIQGYLYGLF